MPTKEQGRRREESGRKSSLLILVIMIIDSPSRCTSCAKCDMCKEAGDEEQLKVSERLFVLFSFIFLLFPIQVEERTQTVVIIITT